MRCERVRSLYDEYSRETLPVATLNRVEEHLVACPACREYYESCDAIADLIRHSSEVAHPGNGYFEDLNARVLKALDEPGRPVSDPGKILSIPASQWRRPIWWTGAAAAGALILLAAWPLLQPAGSPTMASGPAVTPSANLAQAEANRAATAGSEAPLAPTPTAMLLAKVDWPRLAQAILNKGISGKSANEPAVERMLASPQARDGAAADDLGAAAKLGASDGDKPPRTGDMTLASLPMTQPRTIPAEIFEELEAVKTRVLAGRIDKDLRSRMHRIEEMIGERAFYKTEVSSMSDFRQIKLYLEAEDALEAGRLDQALIHYRRVLFVDDNTPLATRASLPLADLFFEGTRDWVNFAEAQRYYDRCRRDREGIFSPMERDHITRQLDRLERYKADNWQALGFLHTARQGNWTEMLNAMRGLTGMPGSGLLLPEAVRVALDRLGAHKAPTDITLDLYNLLAKRAEEEQNGDVRAWLELALGDLASTQFQDIPQAKERYRRVLAASGNSSAAKQARLNLDALEKSGLIEAFRKRK